MNWLDMILLCLAGVGCVKGLFDGFIKQVVSLLALLVGIFSCSKVAYLLRGYLLTLGWIPDRWVTISSYVAGFFLLAAVVLAAGELLHRLIDVTPLGFVNHLIGGVLGLIFAVVLSCFVLYGLDLIDPDSHLITNEVKASSHLYPFLTQDLPAVLHLK